MKVSKGVQLFGRFTDYWLRSIDIAKRSRSKKRQAVGLYHLGQVVILKEGRREKERGRHTLQQRHRKEKGGNRTAKNSSVV